MIDERALIERVEAAGPDDLTAILTRPTAREERALRAHLGDERYQRLHAMALRRSVRGRSTTPRGNVVVLHGIMGSDLTVTRAGAQEHIWLRALRIIAGRLELLRLADDGRTEHDPQHTVHASGISKRHYGEILLSLSERWNVRAFWYDWRKDLKVAAADLDARLRGWFDDDAPVHLVAHSMGGLVARTFITQYPERWAAMQDKQSKPAGRLGGRLVMLGTPNHGSFSIPQAITGLLDVIGKLALLDLRHSKSELLAIMNSFVGTYQMLPSPLVLPKMEALYDQETYGDLNVPARLLENARRHHELLQNAVFPERMVYVAGDGQPTLSNVDVGRITSGDAYDVGLAGDGSVPHELGKLQTQDNAEVSTFYVVEHHGNLTANDRILASLTELLETGTTEHLSQTPPARRGAAQAAPAEGQLARERLAAEAQADSEVVERFARRVAMRGGVRGAASGGPAVSEESALSDPSVYVRVAVPGSPGTASRESEGLAGLVTEVGVAATAASAAGSSAYISVEEREVEESITRHFLASRGPANAGAARRRAFFPPARIEIGLLYGKIEDAHEQAAVSASGAALDALSVGHYLGVRPQAAERALDEAISRTLLGKLFDRGQDIPDADLLLTQYTERGTLRGELGQPFFLTDPRPPGARAASRRRRAARGAGKDAAHKPVEGGVDRLIAIAGMGLPGRFGVPELTVLARELCWALGRMGRRHLGTVLIGAGNGNLPVQDAAGAWMRGIKHAVTGSHEDEGRRIERITFVERGPRQVQAIHEALIAEMERQDITRFQIVYDRAPVDAMLEQLQRDAIEQEIRVLRRTWEERREQLREWQARRASGEAELAADRTNEVDHLVRDAQLREPAPTRITVGLDRATSIYRFGAITATAAIPEREIPLDPELVARANDELAAEWDPALQRERGQFLRELLIPDDLQPQLVTNAPLVLVLDATTARVHWEMLALSDAAALDGMAGLAGAPLSTASTAAADEDMARSFLGTSRSVTRQLRTTFAPPPEPPPPPRRVLRALIVADPAEDNHLPGAEAEGVAVADMFDAFNHLYEGRTENQVEVVRLFGPHEATRTNVLRQLMTRSFDVFHFAGHCVYDTANPAASGFIFTGGARLTANELKRVDRVPKFILSNACESGLTPDRSEARSVDLAPSFAEAFFARGVANFVCTAWPVDDAAAREFAMTLYCGLLRLTREEQSARGYRRGRLLAMHEAMREARLAIARTRHGARTWGAYQHYGSPHFRFFNESTFLLNIPLDA